jgi:hypothetical protein
MKASGYTRNRRWLLGIILAVIALGLASRKYSDFLPEVLGNYPGDALWAVTAYLAIAFVAPGLSVWKLAGIALAGSFLVEFAQLIQVPWINAVRATRVGHLLLGQGFDAVDLVALTLGVGLAAGVDAICKFIASRSS